MLLLQSKLMEPYGHGVISIMVLEELMQIIEELVVLPDLHQFKLLALHGGVEQLQDHLQHYIQKLMEHCGHVDLILMDN